MNTILDPKVNAVDRREARKPKRKSRKLYTSEAQETCRLCPAPIHAGDKFVRGLTGEAYHRLCRKLLRPPVQERPLENSPIKLGPKIDFCVACSDQIRDDEKATSFQGRHWHKECYLRERRM